VIVLPRHARSTHAQVPGNVAIELPKGYYVYTISVSDVVRYIGKGIGLRLYSHMNEVIVIDRALRDEGTSHHYLPPSAYAHADPALIALAQAALGDVRTKVFVGPTWTTDAPFRETESTIAARRAQGILAVEMESAALYAFAAARRRPVICVAHVSNQLGRVEGDFEKGEANGAHGSAELVRAIAEGFVATRQAGPLLTRT
jgi:uridine phosphorylase